MRLILTIAACLALLAIAPAQAPRATLRVAPTSGQSISGPVGGPYSPASFAYQLTASQSWVNVRVDNVPDWLTLNLSSNRTPATATFTVKPSQQISGPGGYDATISFVNTTNGQGNTTRPIHITISAPPPRPNLSFSSDASPTTYSHLGDVLRFAYRVTNAGTTQATRILITSSLNSSIACAGNSLAPGQSMVCTSDYTVTNVGANIVDTASLVADNIGQAMTATTTVAYVAPPIATDLVFSESVSPTTYTNPGDSVTFSYTVQNVGSDKATGIIVTSSLGAQVSCPNTQLVGGATMVCTGPYAIYADGRDVIDNGTLTADSFNPRYASALVTYRPPPPVPSGCTPDLCAAFPHFCDASQPSSFCKGR